MDLEIAKQIRNITEKDAIKDFLKLFTIDLNNVTAETRIGNKFIYFFMLEEILNTKCYRGFNFYDFISMTDYHKKPYIQSVINYKRNKNSTKDVSYIKKLFSVYSLHCGSISIFKPIRAIEIYERFKPKSVLDFTCGWGGRMIGAIVSRVENYVGIDLNHNLTNRYQKMIETLSTLPKKYFKTNVTLLFQDCLKVDYSQIKYDMVFTSPPYYNIELYNGTKERSVDEWNCFYREIFSKTYKYLSVDGWFILNINQQIYNEVCIELLGEAHIILPFLKKNRNKNTKLIKDYQEFIYCWKK